MKVVTLAGGVGGAKLVHGLAANLSPDELTVIVNTGDDFEHCGLFISPDLDTVCYTLAGIANPATGWGRVDETWHVFQTMQALGGPNWFQLGDKDIATHLFRTHRLVHGEKLSAITLEMCAAWGVQYPVYPMSDDAVRTIVHTVDAGRLSFQEYFVKYHCGPRIQSFEFKGAEQASPVAEAMTKISAADLVVFAPSNPWVSIDPILSIPGFRENLQDKVIIAVSPIVGGEALKGPAAKMYRDFGIQPSAAAVAEHYKRLLSGFVFDQKDKAEVEKIEAWRIISLITDTIMKDDQERTRLANEILKFGETILKRNQ